jgi:hydroxymethylglutaryl-CoA lyase
MDFDRALIGVKEMIELAHTEDRVVRAGIQCAFGCVYEGAISESAVLASAEKMIAAGIDEINLADSTGMANPQTIGSLVGLVTRQFPDVRISLHLHDTRGLGLANMFSGYEAGVRVFDVCAGGLGGCPFIKGAAGNVPTEDAVHMFESMGIATGIELTSLMGAVDYLENSLGRSLPGRMKRVFDFQQNCNN